MFVLAVLVGCGREPLSYTVGQGTDGAAPPSDGATPRTPMNHRAVGASCPSQRAPNPPPECAPGTSSGPPVNCGQDSDCTMGTNGRCLRAFGPNRCGGECSYDECSTDADCAAPLPCECRTSDTDTAPNICVATSNCRVDGDCGPGGFCSPSVVDDFCFCPSPDLCDPNDGGGCFAGTMKVPCACGDACGHGYFCHTAHDNCVDDSDCGAGDTCNYDRLKDLWSCTTCWPIP